MQARTVEKSDIITNALESAQGYDIDANRLSYARVDGPSVTMAYIAEDKNYVSGLPFTYGSSLTGLVPR